MSKIKGFFQKAYEGFDNVLNFIHKGFKFLIDNGGVYILAIVLLILSFVARIGSLDIVTHDVNAFLRGWYQNFYDEGITALGKEIGDYTPAYMYFIYFISLFKFDPQGMEFVHAIKYISIFFDYVSAVFIFLSLKKITKNDVLSVLGAGLFLFIPTIFLNAAYWGQCDGIYVSFCIISLYFLLCDRQRLAFIFLGLAFSFKLQAIFFLPIFLILFLQGKIKIRYILYVPLVYILMSVPSMICGRSFASIMSVYVNQTAHSYDQLTLNSSTFYALIFHNFQPMKELDQYGICLAIAINGAFIYLIHALKVEIDQKKMVAVVLFFSLLMPFFMTHMHERYFYMADVLCILYVILNPKKAYILPLILLPSLTCYMLYLFNIQFFIDTITTLRLGALMYIAALIIIGIDIFSKKKEDVKQLPIKQES